MTERDARDIVRHRLLSHGLAGAPFAGVGEVVGWLGAMQAQEYAVAKWSVGQRATGLSEADLDAALADGTLIRTHVLRPTWHFVAAADIRWLLALTAPRVHALNAYSYRKFGLDEAVRARSDALLAEALAGGQQLTRPELAAALAAGGIEADGLRLGYLLMHAELAAVICSGVVRGRQRTYARFDERVPPDTRGWDRDEALAELVRRYYLSHGPATRADLQGWASLTAADAMRGLALAWKHLDHLVVDGVTYWHGAGPPPGSPDPSPTVHLLQGYDEYLVAYSESRAAATQDPSSSSTPEGRAPYLHIINLDGQCVGTWQRKVRARSMTIEVQLRRPLAEAEHAALAAAADRYTAFAGRRPPAQLIMT